MKKIFFIIIIFPPFTFYDLLQSINYDGDIRLTSKFLAIGYYIILLMGYVIYKKYIQKKIKK